MSARADGAFRFGRREAAELLDERGHDAAELAANLRDIRTVNRLAGGTRVVLRQLPALLAGLPPGQPAAILDVATGSADIPVAVARWGRRHRPVKIVASDLHAEILAAAEPLVAPYPEIALLRCDALALPLPDGAVDVALCSLALHHFAPDEAVCLVREMDRVARVGCVLNDIDRSPLGYAAAWAASRVATRNRLTRHDMPLSVRRAYTPDELRELLRRAGVRGARVSRHPLFRMAAVWSAGGGQGRAEQR